MVSEPKPDIKASLQAARRLAAAKQHLAGELPARATKEKLISLVRDLAYVQWDPVPIVAPSHIISFWSRVGDFRLEDLEDLLWREKKLFLHWTPVASIVLSEDFPLYFSLMKRYPESLNKGWANHVPRARKFLAGHRKLRESVLSELKGGPLTLTQFKDYARTRRSADGWSSGSDVSNMLSHLLMSGEVVVVGHEGNQNVWGLPEMILPGWKKAEELSAEEFERRAAERAIGALGTASTGEIYYYFVRGRYQNLERALEWLLADGRIRRVQVEGVPGRDQRYVRASDVRLLESITDGEWWPRLSLIPPFDNALAGNARLRKLYDFEYSREQFLPKEKRRFGTYVIPLFWDDSFIGRIDPEMDRKGSRLVVNSVHAEPGAPEGKEVASAIADTIGRFGRFLGADEVVYSAHVPPGWKGPLR